MTHAIEGTSAKLQGLQVDDQILAVDGQSIADMSLVSVFEQLAGNLNTSVQLKIYRESQGEFEIQLTRHSQYLLATAFASRALAHYGLDNPQQAFSDCNQAKQIDPTNAFAYQFCGAIHQSSGNSQAAIADYQRALTLFTEQGDDASVERVKTLLEQLSSQQLEP